MSCYNKFVEIQEFSARRNIDKSVFRIRMEETNCTFVRKNPAFIGE